ncbi:MAG: hypothetical protein LBQ41_04050 [Candidatus Ancillula sp.]|jgi:uncharacterized membrane protein YhaH (DUF805 family)|nr:hypothetical protein [Candidatus Ancillula sp.]
MKNDTKVTHGQGVRLFFKNIVNFGGKSGKSEFLQAFIFTLYIGVALAVIEAALLFIAIIPILQPLLSASRIPGRTGSHPSDVVQRAAEQAVLSPSFLIPILIVCLIAIAYSVVFGLAWASLCARRLRSAGVSKGWLVTAICVSYFASVIPGVGGIISLVAFILICIIGISRPELPEDNLTFFDVLSGKTESAANTTPAPTPVQHQYVSQPQPDVQQQYVTQPQPVVQPVAPPTAPVQQAVQPVPPSASPEHPRI